MFEEGIDRSRASPPTGQVSPSRSDGGRFGVPEKIPARGVDIRTMPARGRWNKDNINSTGTHDRTFGRYDAANGSLSRIVSVGRSVSVARSIEGSGQFHRKGDVGRIALRDSNKLGVHAEPKEWRDRSAHRVPIATAAATREEPQFRGEPGNVTAASSSHDRAPMPENDSQSPELSGELWVDAFSLQSWLDDYLINSLRSPSDVLSQ